MSHRDPRTRLLVGRVIFVVLCVGMVAALTLSLASAADASPTRTATSAGSFELRL